MIAGPYYRFDPKTSLDFANTAAEPLAFSEDSFLDAVKKTLAVPFTLQPQMKIVHPDLYARYIAGDPEVAAIIGVPAYTGPK